MAAPTISEAGQHRQDECRGGEHEEPDQHVPSMVDTEPHVT